MAGAGMISATRRRAFWSRPDWADELDFLRPQVRTAPWAWLLLLAGLFAVVTVMPMVTNADAELAQAQDAVRRLQRATHQEAVRDKALAMATRIGGGDARTLPTAERVRAANRMAQTLAYPWMPVLTQVETAAQARQAVLLSFSLDLGALDGRPDARAEVRLSAAVVDDTQALQWAQAHGPQARLQSRDRLSKPLETSSGRYAWRAQALWPGVLP